MIDYNEIWNGYKIYADLHKNDITPAVILSFVFKHFEVNSAVDFGCATGRWLACAKTLGVKDVLGIDGDYVDRNMLEIDKNEFYGTDISQPINLNKKYDMAISLETAEHLEEKYSDTFIENLTKAADVILFSAAAPFQGGDYHFNEQPVSYWEEKFKKFGFVICDCVRPFAWNREDVDVIYRQNVVLFVQQGTKVPDNLPLNTITDIIHPKMLKAQYKPHFPFFYVPKDSVIVLYGAGGFGKQYYLDLISRNYAKEIIWVDKNVRKAEIKYGDTYDVFAPEEIMNHDYDCVVVAIENVNTYYEIKQELIDKYNVDAQKIIWQR